MGKYDSSLTRVQPVFKQLVAQDGSGQSWLRPLLEMAVRPDKPAGWTAAVLPQTIGPLVQDNPRFEFAAPAPLAFLQWLLAHPDRLTAPSPKYLAKLSERTRKKREALRAGNTGTHDEALVELDRHWPDIARGAWWAFEGPSYVDCALFTGDTVVFIEGKRTEMGPSEDVAWYRGRNQVLRNVECARTLAQRKNLKHYFALLIVEDEGKSDAPAAAARARNHATVAEPATVAASFPHLPQSQRDALVEHYLGVTTWQAIAARFGVTLP